VLAVRICALLNFEFLTALGYFHSSYERGSIKSVTGGGVLIADADGHRTGGGQPIDVCRHWGKGSNISKKKQKKIGPEAGQYFHVPWQSPPGIFCKIGLFFFTYTRMAELKENMTFGECPTLGHLSHFENTKWFYNKIFFANTRITKNRKDQVIEGDVAVTPLRISVPLTHTTAMAG